MGDIYLDDSGNFSASVDLLDLPKETLMDIISQQINISHIQSELIWKSLKSHSKHPAALKEKQYIQIKKEEIDTSILINMTSQIVAGMVFLEDNHIIHRDLALRNVLVGGQSPSYIIKVSDFGLSRATGDKEYYKSESKTIPFKWCSPEILQHGLYTHKSDVWAFGISLWELFSYGSLPYIGMTNSEASEKVLQGYRMNPPENCPNEIDELMIKCWSHKSEDRPSFQEIHSIIYQSFPKKTSEIPSNQDGEMSIHYDESLRDEVKMDYISSLV